MLGAPETTIKERLGHAVFDLIASRAGCQVTQPHTDLKSVDVNVSPMSGTLPAQIDAQIKGVTTLEPDGAYLKYKLKRRNYDHLRLTGLMVPRILVVADIHTDSENWVVCDSDHVRFSNCVYWMDLHAFPDATQKTNVPILIPRDNRLTSDRLVALMERGYDNAKSGKGGVS